MLKDLTAILLRPDALILVLTFIPGLFFLLAVGTASPDLAFIVSGLHKLPFGNYASIFAALFAAFVIGATFITFVTLIRHFVIDSAFRLWYFLKPIVCKHILLPGLNRLMIGPPPTPDSPPRKPIPNSLITLRQKIMRAAFPPDAAHDPAFLWWAALTEQLLKERFHLEKPPAASFQPLRDILTEPTRRELHGDMMFLTLDATGWSALAATYFAPALRVTWFYVFAFFLIANGLLHSISVVRILANPEIGDILRLRSLLREFPKLKSATPAKNKPENNGDEE